MISLSQLSQGTIGATPTQSSLPNYGNMTWDEAVGSSNSSNTSTSIGGQFKNAGGDFINDIKNLPQGTLDAISNFGNAAADTGTGLRAVSDKYNVGESNDIRNTANAGLDSSGVLGGGLMKMVGSLISPLIQGTANVTSDFAPNAQANYTGAVDPDKLNTAVQNFLNTPQGKTVVNAITSHPDAIRIIGDLTKATGGAAVLTASPEDIGNSVADTVGATKNALVGTPELAPELSKIIDNHIASAKQVASDPDSGASVPDAIGRAKINIVDSLKQAGETDTAAKISKIDTSNIKSIDDFNSAVKDATGAQEGIVGKAKGAINDIKNSIGKDSQNSDSTVEKSIQDTMAAPTKGVKVEALENSMPDSGGVQRKGILKTSEIQPNDADVKRGTIADEYIGKTNDPVEKIQNVNKGIKDTSKQVDSFLNEKSSPSNFSDMRDYIEANNKPSANLQKDPGASEAYTRASNNALDTLYKTMKNSANESGDFGETTPGSDIRKARIAVDKEIKSELGENVFGTPQYKGIKAAEVNVRGVLNNMQEDMLRYPGQLEQLNKYNDFVNTLKSKNPDIEISPEHAQELKDKFGLKSTPESESDAKLLSDQHSKMSNLYDARDNMIDKYVKDVGKNRIEETIEHSKLLSGAVKLGKYGARRIGSMELFSLLRKL